MFKNWPQGLRILFGTIAALLLVLVGVGIGGAGTEPTDVSTQSTRLPVTKTVVMTAPPSTVTVPPSTVTKTKKVTVTKSVTKTVQPRVPQRTNDAPAASGDYYDNCSEARAAGVTPLYRGDPGYGSHLDRDGDGVACE